VSLRCAAVRYLITGGAGFIGSHLCDALLERGDEVHVIDDLSTGSIDNIRHLQGNLRFDYTIESAASEEVVAELLEQADAVYHLAAAVGVELIVESPVATIETNVHCTEVVLTQANKQQKPVFIASTSEVYGKSTTLPFREDDDLVLGATVKGRWSYACSKAIDVFLAIAYWKERKLPTVIGRLFNTVGPRQTGRYGMVIPTLVQQALAGQPMTVFGDGTQQRCFCHVRDTVAAMVELMLRDDVHGQVFNVGSTHEVSMLELAERIRAITGSSSEIVLVPYDEAYEQGFEDMPRRVPDITRIQALIGWHPRVELEEIITDVVEHQRTADVY
jgi:UDP-glucose 4-epimerase